MLTQLKKAFCHYPPEIQFLVSVLYTNTDGDYMPHPAFEMRHAATLQEVAAIGRELSEFRLHIKVQLRLSVRPVILYKEEVFEL